MKKKLLIVDDEEKVLSGMRRALHPLSPHWTMDFLTNGQDAIVSHQTSPCDVLISDYRMPLMDGFELLSWFRKNAPGTLRITLTGQIDRETYLKNLGVSHYFIWKPARSSVVRHILTRAEDVDRFISSGKIRSHLQNLTGLPTPEATHRHFQSLLQQDGIDYHQLAEVIASDLSLSAQVLRILYTVNPSGKEFESLLQGLRYLGAKTLRELLFDADQLLDPLPENDISLRLKTLSEHSRKTAQLAQLLMSQASQKEQFHTYFSALFHDLGSLLLYLCWPDEYAEICRLTGTRFISQTQAEQEVLGYNHAELGGFIACLWGFPEEIVAAIYHHHVHTPTASSPSPVVEAVWHANRISHGRLGQSTRQYEQIMALQSPSTNGQPGLARTRMS